MIKLIKQFCTAGGPTAVYLIAGLSQSAAKSPPPRLGFNTAFAGQRCCWRTIDDSFTKKDQAEFFPALKNLNIKNHA